MKPSQVMVRAAPFVAGALLVTAVVMLFMLPVANANMLYAKQTGQNCVQCHADGKGGKLTDYGVKFKTNGFKVPAKTETKTETKQH